MMKNPTFSYSMIGILFGLSFPVTSLIMENYWLRAEPTSLMQLISENPIQNIVLLAPFVLGITFYLIGKSQTKLQNQLLQTKQAEKRLLHTVHHDQLTGRRNRLCLITTLQDFFDNPDEETVPSVIYLLDLDRFKAVNDTLGHHVGDLFLISVCDRLATVLTQSQRLYRLGGDEFIVLDFVPATMANIEKTANQLLKQFDEPFLILNSRISTGCSIGITDVVTTDNNEVDILTRADLALYEAKTIFGNTFKIYDKKMAENFSYRMTLEQKIRHGIENNDFHMVYQPVFSLKNNRIRGFEALMRWTDPQMGTIPPDQFIPIAETSGLIMALGKFALTTACQEAASWPTPLAVSVNVSVEEFKQQSFCEQVVTILNQTGLPPGRLTLEITESLFITDIETVQETINKLRNLGVKFALDDFGTGYSSLNHLRRLDLDFLKLDKSFAKSVADSESERNLVRSIVEIGKHFHLITLIEGVENIEELKVLQEIGLDLAQGYFFSKPLRHNQISSYIEAMTEWHESKEQVIAS